MTAAILVGIDQMVAQKLGEVLLAKDILVIGVGEGAGELEKDRRFVLVESIDQVEETAAYVFDFRGDQTVWNRVGREGGKLAVVSVDGKVSLQGLGGHLEKMGVNWRTIEIHEVYGPAMDLDSNWVGEAVTLAVLNRPLRLPTESSLRPVAVEDAVEAIMRCCFMSGTTGEHFIFGGAAMERDVVAEILKKEAKMTREGVELTGRGLVLFNDSQIEEQWQRLRWVPVRSFEESITETLQYFFTVADTLGRKKQDGNKVSLPPIQEKELPNREFFEVAVDEVETESVLKDEPVQTEEVATEEIIEETAEQVEDIPQLAWVKPVSVEKELEAAEEEAEIVEVPIVAKPLVLPVEPKIKRKPIVSKKILGRILLGLGGVLVVGSLILLLAVWRTVAGMQTIEAAIKKQDWRAAEKATTTSLQTVRSWESTFSSLGVGGDLSALARLVDQGLVAVHEGLPAMESGQKLYQGVLSDQTIEVAKVIQEMNVSLTKVVADLGVVQARSEGEWRLLPGVMREKLAATNKTLGVWRERLTKGVAVLRILPDFIGSDGGRRDWMILFQNEQELRPTGGFIGSYGIMSFENGKLLNLEVQDVYSADGQLKGHVEPPEPIKSVLEEAGWYMRDANWRPSLPAAAKDILWFLDKETGRSVNGLVTIDLAVVRAILGITGEIYLPDFKEKINKDNLYEQAEFYSEQKFFPGSHQKANFLGALAKQLFETIKSLPLEKQVQLASTMIDLADRNELQIVAHNQASAQVLAGLGWDGAMYEGGCLVDHCVADYLYVVEANLGVNKANYFVRRSMEQLIDLSDHSLSRVLKINYENTAKSATWPGGDYKNYMRVYVPADVSVASVATYDPMTPNLKTMIGEGEMVVAQTGSKKELGFLVTVGVGKKLTVELRYNSVIDLTKGSSFSYLGFIQRQSGYGDTGLVSLITYPDTWQPLQVEPTASVVGNKLIFNQKLERDIKMGVELGK